MSFNIINEFENEIANFFGAPFAVAVDCCTHAIELCLIKDNVKSINVPRRTYISIPMLSNKLNIKLEWNDDEWKDYYFLTDKIIDAAVLWEKNSYISNKFMCISFQYRKHLSLGRGGAILLSSKKEYDLLKRMSYDGRSPDTPWIEQDIYSMGYHYYMTPETAELGLKKLPLAKKTIPKKWTINDWPDVSKMKVFQS